MPGVLHRPPGGAGAETAGQSDTLGWRVCAEQQVPRAGDTGEAGQGRPACQERGSGGGHAPRRAAMTWAQRLKRVFGIDIKTCPACGGVMRIIACIEDPEVIANILAHLQTQGAEPQARRRPPCRAPPQRELFDKTG